MVVKESVIEREILSRAMDNELSCPDAFEVAWKLQIPARDVGSAADRLNHKIVKCQLGLFGHRPDKKIVKVNDFISKDLEAAIHNRLDNGKILCINAWEIAGALNLSRFSVSCACETLGIKIKECQLGAF